MRCLAKDPERRFAERHRAPPGAAGGAGRRARAPARRDRGAAGGGAARGGAAAQTPRKPGRKAGRGRARAARGRAAVLREQEQRRGDSRGRQRASARSWRTRRACKYVLAFGHEVGDNPTRAAATAGEMFIARGPGEGARWSTWRRCRSRRAPTGRAATRARCSRKKEQYPGEADPAGVLLSPAAVEVLPDASSEPVASRPGFMLLQKARRRPRSGRRRGWASRRWSGATTCCARCSMWRAAASASAGPTITTLLGEPGLRQDATSRRCWCSTSRCRRACRRCSSAPRRCWAAWASRRRASCCSGRCRCPTRRRRISAARCWRSELGAETERGGVGGRRGGDGRGRRPNTPSCVRWRRRRARLRSAAARALGEALRLMVARQAAGAGHRGRALRRRDRAGRDRIRDAEGGGVSDLGVRRRAARVRPRPHRLGGPRGEAPVR